MKEIQVNSPDNVFIRYTILPKILHSFIEDQDINGDIKWPREKINKSSGGFYSLEKPKTSYSDNNIKHAIWVTCWNATYWYHNGEEKKVHINDLIIAFPRISVNQDQSDMIIRYIVEAVSMFGDSDRAKFENLCYLVHYIKPFFNKKTHIRTTNKLMLASKRLNYGKILKIYDVSVRTKVKVESKKVTNSEKSNSSQSHSITMGKSKSLAFHKRKETLEDNPVDLNSS